MKHDLLNILSNSNKDIDNQQLMDYISGQLSEAEKHNVEESMADNDFMNDAIEGLQGISNKKNIAGYVEQLNRELQKSVQKKKVRREKRRIKEGPWSYLAILLIIILCIVAYLVVRRMLDHP